MRTIKVLPLPGGWIVASEVAEPTVFRSAAAAEQKANELGRLVAGMAEQSQVLVHDRRGVLVGSTVMGPRRPPKISKFVTDEPNSRATCERRR